MKKRRTSNNFGNASMQPKALNQLIWMVVCAVSVILISATALAQTDININDRNIIRFGGDVIVPANQVFENAHAIGGDVTIEEGAKVTQTAIAIGGDVILAENARVDGDGAPWYALIESPTQLAGVQGN